MHPDRAVTLRRDLPVREVRQRARRHQPEHAGGAGVDVRVVDDGGGADADHLHGAAVPVPAVRNLRRR